MLQRENSEIVKIVINFDNGKTYEVDTDGTVSKFITNVNKHQVEQTNYNNLFGSISSNTISLSIFDLENNLDITNTSSPYYSYMRNGVKIQTYISYDEGVNYEDYGEFYVTEWGNVYYDGIQDVVTITGADKIQYIINSDMPKLSAYSGIAISSLIVNVLTGLGIEQSKIKIDKSLDYNLQYGVSEDEKVGYFLNEVCQALCAILIIDDHGNILIMPALSGYGETYNLDTQYIVSKSGSNNTNNIYSRVKLRYYKKVGQGYGDILSDSETLKIGSNEFHNILFNNKALSISEIRIETEDNIDNDKIIVQDFKGYQNGLDITIVNNTGSEKEVTIYVVGDYIKTNENFVYSSIDYTDNKQVVSYEMTNQYVQTEADAQVISDKMAKYIELMNMKISLSTLYTPRVNIGDILVFNDLDLKLQGKYKVIECTTIHGTDYQNNIVIIPLRTCTSWEDKKAWDDNTSWLENLGLSLQ